MHGAHGTHDERSTLALASTTVRTRHRSTPSFVERLGSHGTRVALVDDDTVYTYAELVERIDDEAAAFDRESPQGLDHLGAPARRVVHVSGGNRIDTIVRHLAALRAGHVVLLTPDSDRGREIGARFVTDRADRPDRPVRPHPELALLMPTSGSTGAAKVVRLSGEGVDANAIAIAGALGLTADDRAITSLPLHYCYGLSVLHSHLAVGASIVLSEDSVVDDRFWQTVRQHAVTTFAGVPHTFELLARLERHGHDPLAAPSLRLVTQAGGRLPVTQVRHRVAQAARLGHRFAVMYGQTEATARMTVLDPAEVALAPHTVGRPIPGGSITLHPHPGAPHGAGEVVYRGPNVMLGYATDVDDLALGRTVHELHTGDFGLIDAEGRLEIVGRASRFVKPFGIRVDLDELARRLAHHGLDAVVTGDDESIVVARLDDRDDSYDRDAPAPARCDAAIARVAAELGLPVGVFRLMPGSAPRLDNGKPDLAGLLALGRSIDAPRDGRATGDTTGHTTGHAPGGRVDVAAFFERALGHRRRTGEVVSGSDTFVSLGGDSLSYVEISIGLERLLGTLPASWHLRTVDELQSLADAAAEPRSNGAGVADGEGEPAPRRWWRHVETTVVLRAIAIVLVVGTHMDVFFLRGGAHALLAVAGHNLARFRLTADEAAHRTRHSLRAIARIAVPTSAWIGANMIVAGGYSIGTALLVNNYTGSSWRRNGRWNYWYLEALVQIMLVVTLLWSFGPLRRAERRWPFAVASAFGALTLALRFEVVQFGDPYNAVFRTHTVAWCFAIGWMAARASTTWQRVVVSLAVVAAVPGFFGDGHRELVVVAAMLLLVWVRQVPVPAPAVGVVGTLASASFVVFLVHWQVWPLMLEWFVPWVALAGTLAVGVGAWAVSRAIAAAIAHRGDQSPRAAHHERSNATASS
ncbi:MAG: AMP-binding protein [Actinobacteria bacterium]|nr:AMP-binding protein [Actinomycetota bacterium]